jgi:hypothetical protein
MNLLQRSQLSSQKSRAPNSSGSSSLRSGGGLNEMKTSSVKPSTLNIAETTNSRSGYENKIQAIPIQKNKISNSSSRTMMSQGPRTNVKKGL